LTVAAGGFILYCLYGGGPLEERQGGRENLTNALVPLKRRCGGKRRAAREVGILFFYFAALACGVRSFVTAPFAHTHGLGTLLFRDRRKCVKEPGAWPRLVRGRRGGRGTADGQESEGRRRRGDRERERTRVGCTGTGRQEAQERRRGAGAGEIECRAVSRRRRRSGVWAAKGQAGGMGWDGVGWGGKSRSSTGNQQQQQQQPPLIRTVEKLDRTTSSAAPRTHGH
jgi:hypothetical protein